MNNKKAKKIDQGSAMLISVFLLTAVIFITMSMSEIVVNGLQMSKTQVYSTRAFFAAEAGAEAVLWQVRENGYDPTSTCNNTNYIGVTDAACTAAGLGAAPCCHSSTEIYHTLDLGAIDAEFYIKWITGSPNTINTYGSYQGTRRVIELRF